MSKLPNATKQIVEDPVSGSVTSPTIREVKEKDVEQKLKIYGIFEAFRQGRFPSNRQIDQTLDHVLNHPPATVSKLSKEGRMLVQDGLNIIRPAKRMIDSKNHDEIIQEFLFQTKSVDTSRVNLKDVNAKVGSEEAKADGDQSLEHLRVLGKLILTNSEFRKLLKDISLLGRDVLADGAAKVSNLARPEDADLAQVDDPSRKAGWVGPDGEIRSRHESVPSTGLGEKRDQLKNAGQQVQEEATIHAAGVKDRAQSNVDNGVEGSPDAERAQNGADAFANQASEEKNRLRNKISNAIPDEHKNLAREQVRQAKNYAKEKFPEERQKRFIYRLKKVVVENQSHSQYQEAIEFFLEKAENYTFVAKDIAGQSSSSGLNIRKDGAYQQAETLLRTILERFANGASMQPIFDAVNQLYTDSTNDSELRAWFGQLDIYVRKVLQEPGYIMKPASDKEGRRIVDSGKRFFDPTEGKYSNHKDALFDSITDFFTSYADDPLNVQLGIDVKKLTKDLLMDESGNLKYKHHLWRDVRQVILPLIVSQAGYIPIPRIEYTDNSIDMVIENLTLESANVLPNIVEIDARNYFKVSPYDSIKDQSKHSFSVSFSQVQADLKDVAFYVNKKTGFPKLKDSGVADVFIGGKGISGTIHLTSSKRKDRAFDVVDVKIKIDKLNYAVRGSSHSLLIALTKPIATGLIKKAVCKAMEVAIRNGLYQIDSQLFDITERLEAARDNDDISTIDAIKSTFTEKKEAAIETKEKVTPAGKFQITAERGSRLINWTSPNSIIDKVGEKQDLAVNNSTGWKSPAFDIIQGSGGNHTSSTTSNQSVPLTPTKDQVGLAHSSLNDGKENVGAAEGTRDFKSNMTAAAASQQVAAVHNQTETTSGVPKYLS